MPLEDPQQVSRPTPWQTLVVNAHAKLDEILEAEGRRAPGLSFGKLAWTDGLRAPRAAWVQPGGSFALARHLPTEGELVKPQLGVRLARSRVEMWHASPEHLEHMLDRLWLATTRSAGGEAFRWQTATYDYPTEVEGPWMQNGMSILVLSLPVELRIDGAHDGETELVEVQGSQFRAGIENPQGEAVADTAWEVDRWTG